MTIYNKSRVDNLLNLMQFDCDDKLKKNIYIDIDTREVITTLSNNDEIVSFLITSIDLYGRVTYISDVVASPEELKVVFNSKRLEKFELSKLEKQE
jgi:hypothetical protein